MLNIYTLAQKSKMILYNIFNHNSPIQLAAQKDLYNPYDGLSYLKDIQVTSIDKDYHINKAYSFSLISPVKNEADDIQVFLESIENQSNPPEEVIIVDGGSTDGTQSIIQTFAEKSSLNFQLIEMQSKSISQQRNLAIQKAKNELIVMADAGNILHRNYCKNMIGPLIEYPDADLVGAIFYAIDNTFSNHFIYGWDGFEGWKEYLPAGKTMAVRRSLFLSMGGFPEFLKFTGEDALFDLYYRNVSTHWIFNKAAIVYWDIPRTWEGCLQKFYSYGQGAGENHMGDAGFYIRQAKMRNGEYAPEPIPITDHMFYGFLSGREKRAEIEFNLRNVNGIIIILSENQLQYDENAWRKVEKYIDEHYKVIFISVLRQFPISKYADFDFTLLELYDSASFSVEDLLRRYGRYVNKMQIEILGNNEKLIELSQLINGWRGGN